MRVLKFSTLKTAIFNDFGGYLLNFQQAFSTIQQPAYCSSLSF